MRILVWMAASAASIAATLPAEADLETMTIASSLGQIIGAEAVCGLVYDQAAIAAFIDERVDPAQLDFAASLNMMIMGGRYNAEEWSGAAKAAQCRAVENKARAYGFID